MPPKRGTKRKADTEPDSPSDVPNDVFVDDEPRRATHAPNRARGKSLSRLAKDDDDGGYEGALDFEGWTKWLEKLSKSERRQSKNQLDNFQNKVDKQANQVRALLDTRESRMKQHNQDLAGAFGETYSAAIQPAASPHLPYQQLKGIGRERSELFHAAQAIIGDSHALLKLYKDTDEGLKSRQLETPATVWKKDKDDLKEVLACGREIGENLVERHLAPRTHSQPDPNLSKESEHFKTALELFKDSRNALEGESWGTVAAEQVKRLKNLAITIPSKHFK
ncbi:uncharacterized protein BCR38DRAFT_435092 [Pseudomassariella vexata]|uniref:Uncharacterized protein n=1 Tax=Pseudomassariella vexata TaxID=1141098 RepID=A0A1Y2DYU8_9PEZI|nr:uncharacterized protein BCR38DRAFT_435092 [Pseudomassariella vexata]ORY64433.1 hypothetical protein BCR38DRAFT_435092 [Pseudomassariella vexata]